MARPYGKGRRAHVLANAATLVAVLGFLGVGLSLLGA